jgi:hypothetical protein
LTAYLDADRRPAGFDPPEVKPDYYPGQQQRSRRNYQQRTDWQYNPHFRQQQDPFGFRNNQSSQIDENQLMLRFILFIMTIIVIGLIAYLLFSSLSFY